MGMLIVIRVRDWICSIPGDHREMDWTGSV